ncbi:MAG: hypothetical protein ACREQ7_02415 [Candidatus Binatia bacterium]
MIDTTLAGARCRATKEIRSHQTITGRFTEGTIQYDIDNCGRHLIRVEWDNGITDYAFPFEIEILDGEEVVSESMDSIGDDKIFWS